MAKNTNLKEKIFGAEENSAAKLAPDKLSRFQEIATRMFHTRQLTSRETGIPAISKAGRNLSEIINDTYRTYYFVSILRIDMVYLVLIGTLLGIYNTLIRPLMGIAYDKTRTRWGKARPYLVVGPLFYYGATALMFCARLFINNDDTHDPRKILFVFAMMMIRDTFSTIYKLPLDSYLTLMTPNPEDRMAVGLMELTTYYPAVLETMTMLIDRGLQSNDDGEDEYAQRQRLMAIESEVTELIQLEYQDGNQGNYEANIIALNSEKAAIKAKLEQAQANERRAGNEQARLNEVISGMEKLRYYPIDYDDVVIRQMVECVRVLSKDRLLVRFRIGGEMEVALG